MKLMHSYILYSYFSHKPLFSKENLNYSYVSVDEIQDFAYIWYLTLHTHSAVLVYNFKDLN